MLQNRPFLDFALCKILIGIANTELRAPKMAIFGHFQPKVDGGQKSLLCVGYCGLDRCPGRAPLPHHTIG